MVKLELNCTGNYPHLARHFWSQKLYGAYKLRVMFFEMEILVNKFCFMPEHKFWILQFRKVRWSELSNWWMN